MAPLCAGSSTPLKSQSCASNLAILHAKNWRQPRTPVSDCVRLACWGSLGHAKIYTKINRYGLLMEHLWNLRTWHWTIMKSHSFPSPTVSCANAANPMNPAPGVHTLHSPPLPSSPRSRESIWPITSNRKYRSWLAKSWRDACRDSRSWKGTSASLGNSLTMHNTSLSKGFKKRIHRSEESFFTVNQFSKHLSNKRYGQKTPACSCPKTLSTACLNFSRSDFRGRGVDLWTWLKWQKGHLGRRHLAVLAKNTQGLHVPSACCWIFTWSSVSGSQPCCICCSFEPESVDKTNVASAINLCPQLRARRGCWPTSCHDQHSRDQSHSLQSELLCKFSTAQ